jgi:hypothetical protein
MMLGNAGEFQTETATLDQTRAFLDKVAKAIRNNELDANDLLYRLEASADYDPAKSQRGGGRCALYQFCRR